MIEPVSTCDYCGAPAYYIRTSYDPVWCPRCLGEAMEPAYPEDDFDEVEQ